MARSVSIDKALVARRFSSAAATYDGYARHQQQAAEILCRGIPSGVTPRRILELGCGTGELTARLHGRFPGAEVTAIDLAPGMIAAAQARLSGPIRWVVADAETYLPEQPVALLASSCTAQWFRGAATTVRHAARQVAVGGWVALAIPLPGTLDELLTSVRHATGRERMGLSLEPIEHYVQAFEGGAWGPLATYSVALRCWYDSPLAVLRAVKGIGAVTTGQGGNPAAPLAPREMKRVAAQYRERYARDDGRVPSTYEMGFLYAQRMNEGSGCR